MAHFEKDFIMRQVNDMAKALNQFMDKDAIDDVLSTSEKETDTSTSYDHKKQLDSQIKNEERNNIPTETSNNE